MAKSSRRKPGQTGRNTDANTGADSQNDLPEPDEGDAIESGDDESGDDESDTVDDESDATTDIESGDDVDDEDEDDIDDEDLDDEDLDEAELEADDDEIAPGKKPKDKKSKSDKGRSDKAKKSSGKGAASTKAAAHTPSGGPVRFVRESAAELGKVVWPTRKQMITYTIVVLIFVVFLVAAIGFYDVGISNLMMKIFG